MLIAMTFPCFPGPQIASYCAIFPDFTKILTHMMVLDSANFRRDAGGFPVQCDTNYPRSPPRLHYLLPQITTNAVERWPSAYCAGHASAMYKMLFTLSVHLMLFSTFPFLLFLFIIIARKWFWWLTLKRAPFQDGFSDFALYRTSRRWEAGHADAAPARTPPRRRPTHKVRFHAQQGIGLFPHSDNKLIIWLHRTLLISRYRIGVSLLSLSVVFRHIHYVISQHNFKSYIALELHIFGIISRCFFRPISLLPNVWDFNNKFTMRHIFIILIFLSSFH